MPPSQIPLPLSSPEQFSRGDLIVGAANAKAVAFIESWPEWPVPVAALHGPSGSGKTHLATVWREMAGATALTAAQLASGIIPAAGALVIEDVDGSECSPARDAALFAAIERAGTEAPCLLTGRAHPASWQAVLPDLASRFGAMPALALWTPDEALLAALARKLFTDRQLYVPDAVIEEMLMRLDRSPGAIRDFVGRLDAAALAAAKPVSLTLVRRLIGGAGAERKT